MYVALKRALIKGVTDEEEARTVIRVLRKVNVLLGKFLGSGSASPDQGQVEAEEMVRNQGP